MNEVYVSVHSHIRIQTKVEGSKFIADVFPVESEIEAKKNLDEVRKEFFSATHHCFAYTFGESRSFVRYSDDGEPSGTAGIKIFSAIEARNFYDILAVVTRYFGGTKLGVGGLGRAYFEAADIALKNCNKIQKAIMQIVEIEFPFEQTNPVMNFVSIKKIKIQKTVYTEKSCILTLLILPSLLDETIILLQNAVRGNIVCNKKDLVTVKLI